LLHAALDHLGNDREVVAHRGPDPTAVRDALCEMCKHDASARAGFLNPKSDIAIQVGGANAAIPRAVLPSSLDAAQAVRRRIG